MPASRQGYDAGSTFGTYLLIFIEPVLRGCKRRLLDAAGLAVATALGEPEYQPGKGFSGPERKRVFVTSWWLQVFLYSVKGTAPEAWPWHLSALSLPALAARALLCPGSGVALVHVVQAPRHRSLHLLRRLVLLTSCSSSPCVCRCLGKQALSCHL